MSMTPKKIWHRDGKGLLLTPRSGSYSLFMGILRKYYPNNIPDNVDNTGKRWHPIMSIEDKLLMTEVDTSNLTYAVMVRDPVERFCSACARAGYTIENAINIFESNSHFQKLSDTGCFDNNNVRYFLFPNQIDECGQYLGIDTPVDITNSEITKPIPTNEQIERIQTIYQQDLNLYNELLQSYQ